MHLTGAEELPNLVPQPNIDHVITSIFIVCNTAPLGVDKQSNPLPTLSSQASNGHDL